MILNFFEFVNEELRVDKIDEKTLNILKDNLVYRLKEYRDYILSNIFYNPKTNKVEYKYFDTIDIPIIMRELTNEFTREFVEDFNIETFLRKLNQILELKRINTKRKIKEEFDSYFELIERIIKTRKKRI